MLPSLVAEELRRTLTDFLGTTFALTDDDVRADLERFLLDPDDGIFRGPFVRARLPFRPADDGWRDALDWVPAGFHPHAHQARAWARLSSKGHAPEPVVVTTGTGSGKTESFLIPILDHCRRARAAGEGGIKALILYPMNALANDQARRIAELLETEPDLVGLRAGLYTGDGGTARTVGDGRLIDDRDELRAHPPDILLTNYKMLDFLLLRPQDRPLWTGAPDSLRYLVLDEFHTYDGAQGTDVAMLLRRLAAVLDLPRPGRLLGDVVPVATSATLGDDATGGGDLLTFAGQVFGTELTPDALIGEDRLTPDQWRGGAVEVSRRLPSAALCRLVDEARDDGSPESHLEVAVAAWALLTGTTEDWFAGRDELTGKGGATQLPQPTELGARLRVHPLLDALLAHARTPISLADLVARLLPAWTPQEQRITGRRLISGLLALIALAEDPDRPGRPLLSTEVQVWIREVRRLLRRVGDNDPDHAAFRWESDRSGQALDVHLPAVYCRFCGRSGWAAAYPPAGQTLIVDPATIYREQVRNPGKVAALVHAPGEAGSTLDWGSLTPGLVHWFHPLSGLLTDTPAEDDENAVPVLAPGGAEATRRDRCPACARDDGIRFLGSRVATLTSVLLGHVFGSDNVEPEAKRTLVFTDSVQDAAHRAAFIESRAYALNQRALITAALGDDEVTLDQLGQRIVAHLDGRPATDRYAAIPPDLTDHDAFTPYWTRPRGPDNKTRTRVAQRLQFGAHLELGLNSRTGRSLELTGAVRVEVVVDNVRRLLRDLSSAIAELPQQLSTDDARPPLRPWVWGVLDRMRTQGAVEHSWFDTYLYEDGNRWSIWGGRNRAIGMPAFPGGRDSRPAPAYPVSAAPATEPFHVITSPRGWYARWTSRCLGVPAAHAPALLTALFEVLTTHGILTRRATRSGATAWLIPAHRVAVRATGPQPGATERTLVCGTCSQPFPGAAEHVEALLGGPCLRDTCPGVLELRAVRSDYYRTLYLGGDVRRIVAAEHTGLLDGEDRAAIEAAFKRPTEPDAPNVLACTPTLELGIDIGDLSLVTLTSLPRSTAAYLQRVGRAGRHTGSALIVCVLPSRALELHHLTDPLTMIAGRVRPPACHLDAVEILHRQFLAHRIDQWASTAPRGARRRIRDYLQHGVEPGSWFGDLLAPLRHDTAAHVDRFLDLFGAEVSPATRGDLIAYAAPGPDGAPSPLERQVAAAAERWQSTVAELRRRRSALQSELARLEAFGEAADDTVKIDLRRVRGELRRVGTAWTTAVNEYWLTGLEAAGLLPNYALLDDRTVLDVTLWWTDEESGQHDHTQTSYARGSRTAIGELAPGAVFYVRGSAVRIDGVEVGSGTDATVAALRTCPTCGWSDADRGPVSCPRCGNARTADGGQVLRTVPFRGATAFLAREGARASDARDDRERTMFHIVTAVDVDPAQVTRAWRLADYPFGVEFSRRAVVRWFNLGPEQAGGASRDLAGWTGQAALFHVCRDCGVVPAAQLGPNGRAATPQDVRHRGWCVQRHSATGFDPAGWDTVALGHELQTQVLRLLVPPVLTMDDTLLVSFRAALMIGLRALFGGDPDHLDIAVTSAAGATGARWVMTLHDLVPGGTGYLAQIADPEHVRRMLTAARDELAACPCQGEGLLACHRCLLAHVRSSDAEHARRDRAVETLEAILGAWQPQEVSGLTEIVVGPHESPLEQRFRQALRSWLDSRGVSVAETPTPRGDRWDFRLAVDAASVTWTMRPQVELGYCVPDFVLSTPGQRRQIAVFCDGLAFHNHPACNQVAADSVKRARLTEDGYLVWAITHDDIDAFLAAQAEWDQVISVRSPRPGAQRWASEQRRAMFQQVARQLAAAQPGGGAVAPTALTGDAVTVLARVLQVPDPARWRVASVAAAIALTDGRFGPEVTVDGALAAALEVAGGPQVAAPESTVAHPGRAARVTVSAHGAGIVVLRRPGSMPAVDVVLAVDDRAAVVGSPAQIDAWRDWLALGNVLRLAGQENLSLRAVAVTVGLDELSPVTPGSGPVAAEDVSSTPGPVEAYLIGLLREVDEACRDLVRGLTEPAAVSAIPGFETDDGYPLQIGWPDHRVAVVLSTDTAGRHWLAEQGWTAVVAGDPGAWEALAAAGLIVAGRD